LFSKGIGFQYPDVNVTSRPITDAEFNICKKNGVSKITEILIGRDALVVANSINAPQTSFTPSQLFSALAASVEHEGKIVKNTHTKWTEIHPALPDEPIQVIGPPAASGTYDDFMRLVMEPGCGKFSKINALDLTQRFTVCHSLRSDDAFIQGPRNENTLLGWLRDDPGTFLITLFSFLAPNQDLIAGNAISGITPTVKNISNGMYPLSRPIYVYVKTKHVAAVKGLQQFLYELTNDRTIGPDGYLTDETAGGFVPLDDIARNRARDMAISLAPMAR
jgi:phosphate transport system substrate-binding protein